MPSWAVKWRPSSFADVVGQDMVNEVLKGIIRKGVPPPSIICCGRTGTGKTTSARIYFKAINCHDQQNGEPCQKCDSCIDFQTNGAIDFSEIDASTAGGVEEMRKLAQDCKMVPLKAKYRCVLIDEVHAASRDAFNVLLKMIEEPGDHIKFGFATTEVDKVPKTIMGRCIKFILKPVGISLLKSRVSFVCSKEGLTLDDDVLTEIAIQANGQVRDALMLAEQMSYVDLPTPQAVRNLVGMTSSYTEKDFIVAMDGGDIPAMIELTNDFIENHVDVDRFLNKVIRLLDAAAMKALTDSQFTDFELLASKIEPIVELLIRIRQAPEVAPALFRYWAMTQVEKVAKEKTPV